MNILYYLYRYPGYGGIETATNTIALKLRADGNLLAAFKLYRQNSNYSYILILLGIAFLFLFWEGLCQNFRYFNE